MLTCRILTSNQFRWSNDATTDGRSAAQKPHVPNNATNNAGHEFTVLRLGVARGSMISGTTPTSRCTDTVAPFTNRSNDWKRLTAGCTTTGSPLLVCERSGPGCETPLFLVRPTSRDISRTGTSTRKHCKTGRYQCN